MSTLLHLSTLCLNLLSPHIRLDIRPLTDSLFAPFRLPTSPRPIQRYTHLLHLPSITSLFHPTLYNPHSTSTATTMKVLAILLLFFATITLTMAHPDKNKPPKPPSKCDDYPCRGCCIGWSACIQVCRIQVDIYLCQDSFPCSSATSSTPTRDDAKSSARRRNARAVSNL